MDIVNRSNVMNVYLFSAYQEMARDEVREKEALEWIEATTQDVADAAEHAIMVQLGIEL